MARRATPQPSQDEQLVLSQRTEGIHTDFIMHELHTGSLLQSHSEKKILVIG